jgi:hypothetical protein
MSEIKMKQIAEVPRTYHNIFGFSEGLSAVEYNHKYGFINGDGTEIIGMMFRDVYYFKNGLVPVSDSRRWEFFKTSGERAVFKDIHFTAANPFSDGLAAVKTMREVNKEIIVTKPSEWEYIDKDGEVHCTIEGERADTFVNGLALLIKTPSWYEEPSHETGYNVINKKGERLLDTSRYTKVRKPRNGPVAVCNKWDKWGFVERIGDSLGDEIIPCMYEDLQTFENGLAAAKKDGHWGYINKDNQHVITFKYLTADSFNADFALTSRSVLGKFKRVIVDMSGNEVLLDKYDYMEHIEGPAILVRGKDGRFGYINKEGNEITDINYTFALPIMDGKAAVKMSDWVIVKFV